MRMAAPRSLFAAWDAASASQRLLLAGSVLVSALGIALWLGAAPLTAAIARAEADVARSRLVLEIARERIADSESLARAAPPSRAGEMRAAVDGVLARHGLQSAPVDARSSDGRHTVVIAQARFEALVAALDALAADEGIHVAEATLSALVDPGAVRAELTFAR
jgi:type II secretory pathway component PulM